MSTLLSFFRDGINYAFANVSEYRIHFQTVKPISHILISPTPIQYVASLLNIFLKLRLVDGRLLLLLHVVGLMLSHSVRDYVANYMYLLPEY